MHRQGTSGWCQMVMNDPGAKHPDQMFLTGSRVLEREENRKHGEKPSSQVEID